MLFSILAFILNFLDKLIYFILSLCAKKRPGTKLIKSVELDVEEVKGESKPRVNISMKGKELLTTPVQGCDTLDKLWENSVKVYGNKACMGKRDLKKMYKKSMTLSDGKIKEWLTPEFGEIEFSSYTQVGQRINNFGNGLVALTGMKPGENFGIYENTRPKWMIAAQACFKYSYPVVTVYSTLGEDALIFSIQQTKMVTIVCNGTNVDKLKKAADQIPTLKYVIYVDTYKSDDTSPSPFKVVSFEEVEELGKKTDLIKPVSPKPDSTAIVMYTSGSTGNPKGVIIQHRNIVAAVAAFADVLGDMSKDTHLAYLPLAHIFELAVELGVLSLGGQIGYGSPKTLTDLSTKPCGDLKAVKPTFFIAVPRVFDTIKKGALEKVQAGGVLTQFLFKTAYEAKLQSIKNGTDTPLWNALVFKNFKQNLGGKVQRCVSGGAPLSADTQEFIRVAFGVSIIQGYGLTETCAGGTAQDYKDFQHTTLNVGAPIGSCQIKLVDVKDMNYLTSDLPPRGEVWIKGNNVTSGYYDEKELTKEAWTEDGWFKTGDIGEWNTDGTLKIIDRKKNLVKLSRGEYVALESLESIYSGSPFIAPNGICVYGDSYKNTLVAMILPQESYLKNWAQQNKIEGSFEELCKNPKVIKEVLESLRQEAIKNKKKMHEEIREIRLYPDEWTPESGLLTAAMKLKRSEIVKKYKNDIDEMYKNEK